MTTVIEHDFRQAIESAGLTPPRTLMPGKIVRFPGASKDITNRSGWAWISDDGKAGAYGDWATGLSESWFAGQVDTTTVEQAEHRHRVAELQRIRRQETERAHAEAAKRAKAIWDVAPPADDDHPYLKKKQVKAYGLRIDGHGRLIVPVMIDGRLSSCLRIDEDGTKRFLPGGAVACGHYFIGTPTNISPILVCEGFATGASLHEATGESVAIAFSAGNLLPVAQAIRKTYPSAKLIIAGDHDKSGVGQDKAREAAKATGGVVVIPDSMGEDWNDVAMPDGLATVRQRITAALKAPCVLDEVYDFLGRFVSYPNEEAHVAHTLWVAHTHFMEKWESTPRLSFLSPEPGSGKTRALEVTEPLVPRPVEAVNATPAYIFRKISDPNGAPTILFDEIDTIFGPRAREHEELRGVLNAGHRRGAVAGRCVIRGKSVETEELPAYCAVALAGLGNLPDTILTRSVVIAMRRRAPLEKVEPWRRKIHAPEGHALHCKLAAWAQVVAPHVPENPRMPEGVSDRPADVWEPLLAVAEAAGGTWPERARVTAVTLVTRSLGDQGSLRVRLLGDIRNIFNGIFNMGVSFLSSTDLINALLDIDESPWVDLRGKPLDGRKLAVLLKPYEIAPKVMRKGDKAFRGYEKHDFLDAWSRYLSAEEATVTPLIPLEGVTSVTDVTTRSQSGDGCYMSPLPIETASVTGEPEEVVEL